MENVYLARLRKFLQGSSALPDKLFHPRHQPIILLCFYFTVTAYQGLDELQALEALEESMINNGVIQDNSAEDSDILPTDKRFVELLTKNISKICKVRKCTKFAEVSSNSPLELFYI